jgi:hypothetical protein
MLSRRRAVLLLGLIAMTTAVSAASAAAPATRPQFVQNSMKPASR